MKDSRPSRCEEYRKLLRDDLLGGLEPERQSLLRSHEETCPGCAAERQALSDVLDRLDALRQARLESRLVFQSAAARAIEGKGAGGLEDVPKPSRFSPPVVWMAAAAALIAAAGLAYLFLGGHGRMPSEKAVPIVEAEPPAVPAPEERVEEPVRIPAPPEAVRAVPETRETVEPKVPQEPRPETPPAPPVKKADPAPVSRPEPPKNPAPDAPRPEAPPVPPAPRETIPVVAYLEEAHGEVEVLGEGERIAAAIGHPLLSGQGVRAAGKGSSAVLCFLDGTRIELGADTSLRDLGGKVKGGFLDQGMLAADVVKQAAGSPAVFRTPQARAEVLGTRLTLAVSPGSTRLDVSQGRVRLVRERDGASVDVTPGYFAVVAPGASILPRPVDRKKAPEDRLLPAKVEAAIKKGADYLRAQTAALPADQKPVRLCGTELTLLTFLHAGVPENAPEFQRLFKLMMEGDLQCTYCVSLQAMVLEELDRVRHQGRIAHCAQFLVDNQCKNGQWDYGAPTKLGPLAPVKKGTATGGVRTDPAQDPGPRPKPKVVNRIVVRRQREGGESTGDNSNSQYAALGLRACHEAGIAFPMETVDLAMKCWRACRSEDAAGRDALAGRGWGYHGNEGPIYGSMTAGAAGALVIYDYIKEGKLAWLRDKDVHEGNQWIARNFSAAANPGMGQKNLFYYLYALERLGTLYGTERFGGHEWYAEGTRVVLDAQKADGSWTDGVEGRPESDTCFAILFLRRATRPLVDLASVDRFHPRR